jgi:hypothetical protein
MLAASVMLALLATRGDPASGRVGVGEAAARARKEVKARNFIVSV